VAEKGHHGEGRSRTGAKGQDLIIKVPVGTQILDENNETVLIDFVEDGQEVLFLKGGDGGFGNEKYKTSTNQSPRKKVDGFPGEETWIWLRLKLIADAGIVGLPNAGKSTFLSICTHAKPKIADYPFTTISPNLGVVKFHDKEFILADIPGLIEGAHQGHGLGDRFLGHVERTNILLHLVDGNSDTIAKDYKIIRNELKMYGGDLDKKPFILALNKIDTLSEEERKTKKAILEKASKKEVILLSSATRENLDKILNLLGNEIEKARALKEAEKAEKEETETKLSEEE
jgi:GTP-binding protein